MRITVDQLCYLPLPVVSGNNQEPLFVLFAEMGQIEFELRVAVERLFPSLRRREYAGVFLVEDEAAVAAVRRQRNVLRTAVLVESFYLCKLKSVVFRPGIESHGRIHLDAGEEVAFHGVDVAFEPAHVFPELGAASRITPEIFFQHGNHLFRFVVSGVDSQEGIYFKDGAAGSFFDFIIIFAFPDQLIFAILSDAVEDVDGLFDDGLLRRYPVKGIGPDVLVPEVHQQGSQWCFCNPRLRLLCP